MADPSFVINALEMTNIAEESDLSDEFLNDIGSDLLDAINQDIESRSDWMERTEEWTKLATQVIEDKTFPWPGASNVKYPLLTTAAMQFHARAYPALVNERPVKAEVLGQDPSGEKRASADRVSDHMSFQVMYGMPNWEEHMDRLCFLLPLVGLAFKKTYYSAHWNGPITELVQAQDLVVNYHAKDFETAPRKTHIQTFSQNEMREYMNLGLFRDIDLGTPSDQSMSDGRTDKDKVQGLKPTHRPEDMPYLVYECHTWYDLDDDGYEEPYVITLEKESGQVLRIVSRFSQRSIRYDDNGWIAKIKPTEYFTRFAFIPDPNSNIYALGFGHLLGPINEASNTLINQLIDGGTLSNMQSGFLAKGIRLKGGSTRFRPGEWKFVNTPGEDLHKSVFPMPVREPSSTLFQLLGTLLESGQQLSSVTDIMVGENPGQNQPASTTMAVMEQGMKVFTGIYKRIHRALSKEYSKLYRINAIHTDEAFYFRLLDADQEVYEEDYQLPNINVIPSSDPENVTDTQKLLRAESLWPLVEMGMVNPQIATRRYLEAQGHKDIDQLMEMPDPQPDPETEIEKAKLQLEQQKFEHERKIDWAKMEIDSLKAQAQSLKSETAAIADVVSAQNSSDQTDIEKARLLMEELSQKEDSLNKQVEMLTNMASEELKGETELMKQEEIASRQQALLSGQAPEANPPTSAEVTPPPKQGGGVNV